jgi:hypothetical protein
MGATTAASTPIDAPTKIQNHDQPVTTPPLA